jgi:hypothetical protein
MKTKLFLVTVCFGANFGTAEIFTNDPAGTINSFICGGYVLNNVSVKNA